MQQLRTRLGLVLASTLSIGVLAVAPVYARGDSSSSGTTTSSDDTTSETHTSTTTTTSGETSHMSGSNHSAAEVESEHGTELAATDDSGHHSKDDLRQQALKLLETERKGKPEHSQADRQKACQAHQTEINAKVANFGKQAQRHLDTFNSIFTKVQNFQTEKQLSVSNYDTLVATAGAKQATATDAVATLKSLSVTVDCASADPAVSVATVKGAAKNARDSLHAYRLAIKDIVVALQGAKDSDGNTTTTNTETN